MGSSGQSRWNPARTVGQAVGRGFRRVCPRCGRGTLFSGLLRMHKNCDDCGYCFERESGYFLGSTYVNYGFTAGITTFSYVALHFGAGVSRTWLLPGLLVFCAVFPVLFFSYARSLWLNLDCYVDPVAASADDEIENAKKNPENSAAPG